MTTNNDYFLQFGRSLTPSNVEFDVIFPDWGPNRPAWHVQRLAQNVLRILPCVFLLGDFGWSKRCIVGRVPGVDHLYRISPSQHFDLASRCQPQFGRFWIFHDDVLHPVLVRSVWCINPNGRLWPSSLLRFARSIRGNIDRCGTIYCSRLSISDV